MHSEMRKTIEWSAAGKSQFSIINGIILTYVNSVQASYDKQTGRPVTEVSGDEFDPGETYWKEWIKYSREKLPRKFVIMKNLYPI